MLQVVVVEGEEEEEEGQEEEGDVTTTPSRMEYDGRSASGGSKGETRQ